MLLTPAQYAVRLAWGVGLLFVPAVQEKLCANAPSDPVAPPVRLNHPEAPAEDTSTKDEQPLTLAALAPDVVPPRRADHWRVSAEARVRSLPAAMSLMRDRDDDRPTVDLDSAASPFFVSSNRRPESDPAPVVAVLEQSTFTAHVFESCILETGPPAARAAG